MSVVALFVGLGMALVPMGFWGCRHADELGAVPGMPAEHVERRTAVIRRGATSCLAVGVVLVVVGAASPLF